MEEKRIFQLTAADIRSMRDRLDADFMIAPYQEKNATGCGYNLTATEFVYSISKKRLLPVHKPEQGDTYVKVPPEDTVLLLTREYIKLGGSIAGAFYSRVQMVSSGFGHISTTLDPGWKGMMLFSINNPTKRKLKLTISRASDSGLVFTGIATMVLNPVKLADEETKGVDPSLDNPAMRLDVLKKLVSGPKRFFADRRYQNLKRLIYELEHFEAVENQKMIRLKDIKSHLIVLEKETESHMAAEDIMAYLIELKRIDYDELETLEAKIMELYHTFKSAEDISEMKDEIRNKIEAVYRECDYQLLCEKVNQIHVLIQKQVPHIWNYHTIRQLSGFLVSHWKIWVLYGAAIIGIAIIYQSLDIKGSGMNIFIPSVAAIMPPFISYFLERSDPPNESRL